MLLHVDTCQFSGLSRWLQYPMAEERTGAQTALFHKPMQHGKAKSNLKTLWRAHRQALKKREKQGKEFPVAMHTRPMGYDRKKVFSRKTPRFLLFMPFLSIRFTFGVS